MAASLVHRLPVKLNFQRLSKSGRFLSSIVEEKPSNSLRPVEEVAFPPIKPKYPPGTWSSLDHKLAWQWHEMREKHLALPDVKSRLDALIAPQTWAMLPEPRREHRVHNFDARVKELIDEAATALRVKPLEDHPATLEFKQYITKTSMLPWKPGDGPMKQNVSQSVIDQTTSSLQQHISDFIEMETKNIERNGMSPSAQKAHLCRSLIRCISETLITELGRDLAHLRTCQYGEDVVVRAVWSRNGFERKKRKYTYDPDNEEYDTVQDQGITVEGIFDAMLRSDLPLPEFEPRLNGKSVESEPPKLLFKPAAYGQGKASNKPLKPVIAGHKLGDPCEYGLLAFLSTCDSQQTEETLSLKVAQDSRLAMGLTNTFTWLAAQACNQGFSHLIDLTYPLTSQTILTDGRVFSFLAYQLNTLELWKDDPANKIVNLCWHTPEMALYHSIEQGKVKELNAEVIRQLVQMFLLAPADRGYSMKPTVADQPCPQKFVPDKVVEEVVEEKEEYIVT